MQTLWNVSEWWRSWCHVSTCECTSSQWKCSEWLWSGSVVWSGLILCTVEIYVFRISVTFKQTRHAPILLQQMLPFSQSLWCIHVTHKVSSGPRCTGHGSTGCCIKNHISGLEWQQFASHSDLCFHFLHHFILVLSCSSTAAMAHFIICKPV